MNTDFYTLSITEVTTLTQDAVLVRFSVPDQLKEIFRFTQGQHITIKAEVDGEEVRRSYSICSDVNSQQLQVGIKRIDDGVFSNYANNHLKVGMSMEVMAPQGHFYTELNESNDKNYLCIAAGSGITPIISHIRSILSVEPASKVTLIFSNKSTSLMMFRNKLSFTKNEYLQRFQWINLFTKEEHEATIFNGRISADKLSQLDNSHLIELNSFNEAFLCGPESMVKEVTPFLQSQGLSDEQIHYELFHSDSAEQKVVEKQKQRKSRFSDESSQVSVKISGRKTSFELPIRGTNILDAALQEGADLPFSCTVGVCATCKAKLLSGEVEMDQNHSLTDEEIADGMILTCQSHPISADVEIDFDAV